MPIRPTLTLFTAACLLMLLPAILLTSPAQAHPHVFIATAIEVDLDDDGIAGFWHYWSFDEYFSAWILEEFDVDRNGVLSSQEQQAIYTNTFEGLKQEGYFTRVLKGAENIPVQQIENFTVEVQDGSVVYSFFMPLAIRIGSETEDIFIAVYDESFYCHVFFPPDEIGRRGNVAGWKIDYAPQDLPELAYYFGFVIPTAIRLSISPA